jgi:hypothetical protein
MQQQKNKTEEKNLKINFRDYDSKIFSEMAQRTQKIMDDIEKLNDTWLELFSKNAVEPEGSPNNGRDLDNNEKTILKKYVL